MFYSLFGGINILIWIVGIGTLLAGAVGVSNIMLVTVRERTKEIGIRRALGACPRSILMKIMSESLILTLLAGFFGLFMGVALLYVVDIFMQNMLQSGEQIFFAPPQISFRQQRFRHR
ncbi:MAG: FtsX-like permease family protein [Coprobacter fastidiosus]